MAFFRRRQIDSQFIDIIQVLAFLRTVTSRAWTKVKRTLASFFVTPDSFIRIQMLHSRISPLHVLLF